MPSPDSVHRVNPIIRGSQFLLDRIVDVDSVMQKQFLVAPGRLDGSRQRGQAVDASRFGWKVHLSTPRLPGAGIDAVFQTADKRR